MMTAAASVEVSAPSATAMPAKNVMPSSSVAMSASMLLANGAAPAVVLPVMQGAVLPGMLPPVPPHAAMVPMPTAAAATAIPAVPFPAPNEVAWQFVQDYYTCMHRQPQKLYRFYGEWSQITVGVQGQDVEILEGKHDIKQLFLRLPYQECKVYVQNVDSHRSATGGILIYVHGLMSNGGGNGAPVVPGASEKFSQTFFLAPQPNGYFVLNDILRFESKSMPAEMGASVHEKMAEEEAAEVAVPVEQQPHLSALTETAAEGETVAEAPVVQQVAKPESSFEQPPKVQVEKVPLAKETAPVAAPVNTATTPKSWASLAESGRERWANNAVAATTGVVSAAAEHSTPESSAMEGKSAAAGAPFHGTHATGKFEGNRRETMGHRRTYYDEYPYCVFVTGALDAVSEDEMHVLFGTAGPVKSVDIVPSKKCAFVKFESMEAFQAALSGTFTLKTGNVLTVQERRPPRPYDPNRRFSVGGAGERGGRGGSSGYHRGAGTERRFSRGGRGAFRGGMTHPAATAAHFSSRPPVATTTEPGH